jgi:uncharacterized protein (TIGR02757 family)
MNKKALKSFLDKNFDRYNRTEFIKHDPIQIPHQFTKIQDIEIAGFITATLAWGQRNAIIKKCNELMALMDGSPHQFVLSHQEKDLKRLMNFKHRTFNITDLLYFVEFFKIYYSNHNSLEDAFIPEQTQTFSAQQSLINFQTTFFSLADFPKRTLKHVATPARKSACKRINMFLRWMVRHDDRGVDFGIWKKIQASQLVCPIDLHVERVARNLNLIHRKPVDWKTAIELTESLREFDPDDPVKYDFALFGLGVNEQTKT